MRTFLAPNRIAVYLVATAALLSGILAVLGNLDWTSLAGIIASLVTLLGVVVKWLDGWQAFESRQHQALQGVETAELVPKTRTDVPA